VAPVLAGYTDHKNLPQTAGSSSLEADPTSTHTTIVGDSTAYMINVVLFGQRYNNVEETRIPFLWDGITGTVRTV